jgi:hypothetical protein
MKKLIVFTIAFWSFCSILSAQKSITEGSVDYVMKFSGDNPMMAMMGSPTMALKFKGDLSRLDMNMMNGLIKMTTITDSKKQKALMLMDISMMGKKSAVEMTPDDMKSADKEQIEQVGEVKVDYFYNERKSIMGYDCYKAIVSVGDDVSIVMYLTEAIKIDAKQVNKSMSNVKGFPLEYEMDQQGMKINVVAQKVTTDKQDAKLFELKVPAGYEKMTLDQFKATMGGGIGF